MYYFNLDCEITYYYVMHYHNYVGNWHPEAIKKVFKDFRIKLIKSLPMNDAIFIELLNRENLFSGSLKEQIQGKAAKSDKAGLFLDETIQPSIDIGQFECLNKLLTVMSDEEYLINDPLKQLAAKLREKIDEESSLYSTKLTG